MIRFQKRFIHNNTKFKESMIINVPSSAKTLVISFIGFQTQKVDVKSNVNVVLKSRQTSNVTNALAGQVAGVQTTSNTGQPGKDAEVRIRGIGSISASNKPLYVVDGVPYDGEISAISTSDIESMTVLKDAASNALYGARGANGVILITTKRGKTGDARVTFDAKWGVNKRGVPSYETVTDPGKFYEMAYSAIYNGDLKGYAAAGDLVNANAYANQAMLSSSYLGYQVFTVPNGEQLIGMNLQTIGVMNCLKTTRAKNTTLA